MPSRPHQGAESERFTRYSRSYITGPSQYQSLDVQRSRVAPHPANTPTLKMLQGLEVNLLGLTFGIDPKSLSLKLPLAGRVDLWWAILLCLVLALTRLGSRKFARVRNSMPEEKRSERHTRASVR